MPAPALVEVEVVNPEQLNFILGQTHFIKSVEDLYEAMVQAAPKASFGLAFCEASGPRKIRSDGNDPALQRLAEQNAAAIGAGHSFFIIMRDCFPVTVLNAIKSVPEVCSIFCATANPTIVVLAEAKVGSDTGRAILGVVDGNRPVGVETAEEAAERCAFLRKIGYKR